MFRFVCQGSDKNGNPITTSGCGEVSSVVIDLSIPLPKWGEGKSVSLNKSGSFYFTPEQEKALPKGKLPSEIIEVVNQWSGNAKFLAYGACQTKDCKHDVMIITVKES
jgi:hypothetical protein